MTQLGNRIEANACLHGGNMITTTELEKNTRAFGDDPALGCAKQ
jgi:hypothetical protein